MADVSRAQLVVSMLVPAILLGLGFVLNYGIYAANPVRPETTGEPATSGEYRTQLTVTDADGCSTSAGKHREINPTWCEEADA